MIRWRRKQCCGFPNIASFDINMPKQRTSVAIVMCCPSKALTNYHIGDGSCCDRTSCYQIFNIFNWNMIEWQLFLVSDQGSHALTLECVLKDVLLVGLQDLLFLDTSGEVQISAVSPVDRVLNVITWRSYPVPVQLGGNSKGTERCNSDLSHHPLD